MVTGHGGTEMGRGERERVLQKSENLKLPSLQRAYCSLAQVTDSHCPTSDGPVSVSVSPYLCHALLSQAPLSYIVDTESETYMRQCICAFLISCVYVCMFP